MDVILGWRGSRNMTPSICYVVGAGENYGLNFTPRERDYVIAVDGGFQYLTQENIPADLVIGDFDTLQYVPDHPNVVKLQPEKDDTDLRAAVQEGIRAGYDRFRIYCGTGGRIDHTIANLQLLAELAQDGRQGFLFDRECVITAVKNSRMVFPQSAAGYLSVFAHSGKAEGVFLRGVKYELTDAVLTDTWALGVSNEFIGQEASVSVRNGTLLVVFPTTALDGVSVIAL